MRGMADVNEVTRLRSQIDGLRQEMLHMANRYESLEVINCCSDDTSGFPPYMHTPFAFALRNVSWKSIIQPRAVMVCWGCSQAYVHESLVFLKASLAGRSLCWFHALQTQHLSNEMHGVTLQASQPGPEPQQQQALLQQPSLPQDPAQVSLPSCCSHPACHHRALLHASKTCHVTNSFTLAQYLCVDSPSAAVCHKALVLCTHVDTTGTCCVCACWQALEILELRDQLQDAQDAIKEAHGNSAGLKEHNAQLETQISRLEQLLADAVR